LKKSGSIEAHPAVIARQTHSQHFPL